MSDPPRRWRLSWLGLAVLGLALAIILVVLWLGSRGDLDAVEARGRLMGHTPLSNNEGGRSGNDACTRNRRPLDHDPEAS